jgi:hypothetical protein
MKNELYSEVADFLGAKLYQNTGRSVYGCDLAFTLLEGENVDGSITYNRYKATEWIQEHFDELGEVVERMQDEWKYNAGADIFDNPEKFMVSCYLWIASEICGTLETVDEFWNDEKELTEELNEKILDELEREYIIF